MIHINHIISAITFSQQCWVGQELLAYKRKFSLASFMAECLRRQSSFFEDYNRCMPWHNIWWSYGIHIHQWGSYLLLMWTKMWKRCTERRNLDLERKKLLLKKETWEQAQIPLSLLLDRMKTQRNPKVTAWGHLKSEASESDKHVYASKSEQEYEIHSLDGQPIMDSRRT